MALTYVHRTFNKAGIHDTSLFFYKIQNDIYDKISCRCLKMGGAVNEDNDSGR